MNVGSVVGTTMGSPGLSVYASSKAALVGMTRSLAREVGPRGIRVNLIAPGFIETDMTSDLDAASRKAILDRVPTGRLGTPEDIAVAVQVRHL